MTTLRSDKIVITLFSGTKKNLIYQQTFHEMLERSVHGGLADTVLLSAQCQEQFLGFKGSIEALNNFEHHATLLRVLLPMLMEKRFKDFLR